MDETSEWIYRATPGTQPLTCIDGAGALDRLGDYSMDGETFSGKT